MKIALPRSEVANIAANLQRAHVADASRDVIVGDRVVFVSEPGGFGAPLSVTRIVCHVGAGRVWSLRPLTAAETPKGARALTPRMRQWLEELRDGINPRANTFEFCDLGGAARTEDALKHRGMLDAAGRLTNAGREAIK